MTPDQLEKDFTASVTNMQHTRDTWDLLLNIAYAKLSTEKGFKSRVREGSLSSLLWERSARVVAQFPTGRLRSLSKSNEGKAMLMDLVWNKYVIPNANTDYSFMTKLRLWDYYSLVYGAMPMQYDYRIDDEYVGPDARLIDPRYCYPQVGRTSLNSCDRVYIVTFHGKSYLEARKKFDDWQGGVIDDILGKLDEDSQPDGTSENATDLQQSREENANLHKGQVRLVTMFERGTKGRWITFAPDYDYQILRDIPNPHESGRIPVVFKYAMPLIDSIWGMGDVERGASLQRAIDTVVNLNLDFTKFKIFPPMWYKDGTNIGQLRYEPGARWKLNNGGNDIGFLNPNASSTNEFQAIYQFLKGGLLNQNGTTDTTISSEDKLPGYGRTPQALDQLQKRENARDQWDRNMFEEAYEDLSNGMINLLGTKQAKSIDFHIFDDDVRDLYNAGFKDVMEIYDDAKTFQVGTDPETGNGALDWIVNNHGTAKLTVDQQRLGGKWLYQIDAGTTAANDQQEEFNRVITVANFLASPAGQWLVQGATQENRNIDRAELLDQVITSSGIQNKDKIFDPLGQQTAAAQPPQFDPSMLKNPQLAQQAQGMPQQPTPTGAPVQPDQSADQQVNDGSQAVGVTQ